MRTIGGFIERFEQTNLINIWSQMEAIWKMKIIHISIEECYPFYDYQVVKDDKDWGVGRKVKISEKDYDWLIDMENLFYKYQDRLQYWLENGVQDNENDSSRS